MHQTSVREEEKKKCIRKQEMQQSTVIERYKAMQLLVIKGEEAMSFPVQPRDVQKKLGIAT